jgi:hypothetical protein
MNVGRIDVKGRWELKMRREMERKDGTGRWEC